MRTFLIEKRLKSVAFKIGILTFFKIWILTFFKIGILTFFIIEMECGAYTVQCI